MSSLDDANEIQRRMYEFIVKYMESEGMPPTNREIGRELKIASTGHVDYHLTMLEKKGFISRQAKKSRGITLIKPTVGIPVVGTIAGGEPLDIFPDSAQVVDVGRNLVEDDSTYALIVKGRSMIEDYICDGDYVVVKPQPTVQNGDIVVAVHMQEGISGSATLKRFYEEKDHNRVRLQPANSALEPILIPKTVWDREWQVQGKVVAIYRQIDANIDQDTSNVTKTSKTSEIGNNGIENSNAIASHVVSVSLNKSNASSAEENSNASKNLETSSNQASSEAPPLVYTEEMARAARSKIAQQEFAYESFHTAAKNNHDHVNQIYEQGHSQAKRWFQFGLIAASIGFVIILGGAVIALFTAANIAGVLTSIASIVPGAISALFFQQAKDANKRLDDFYYKELIRLEGINRAVDLTLTTQDDAQDHYKGLIILQLLNLHTQGQEIPIHDLLFSSQESHKLTVIKESSKEFK